MITEKRKIVDLVLRLPDPVDTEDVVSRILLFEKLMSAENDIALENITDHKDLIKEAETWFNQ